MGVAWFGNDAEMQEFVDRHGLTFPNANDDAGEIFRRFEVPAQPAWAFVAADGTVTTHLGAMEPEDLASTFEQLTRSA